MSEQWIQVLTIVGSNLVIMLTFFGISVSLHLGMRQEVHSFNIAIRQDLKAIQDEMKDFHGRLCIIEEKNKKESS